MHIFDQVAEALKADGWRRDGLIFKKRQATGGAFGVAYTILRMDGTGRWLERVDGWGAVERDVDLRNFPNDPRGAIAAVLK